MPYAPPLTAPPRSSSPPVCLDCHHTRSARPCGTRQQAEWPRLWWNGRQRHPPSRGPAALGELGLVTVTGCAYPIPHPPSALSILHPVLVSCPLSLYAHAVSLAAASTGQQQATDVHACNPRTVFTMLCPRVRAVATPRPSTRTRLPSSPTQKSFGCRWTGSCCR